MIAPAASRRSTSTALSAAMLSRHGGLPQVLGNPATLNDSLTVIGTPCSGRLAARQRGIGGAGAFAGPVDLPGDDRVECRVVSLGARHKEVEELDATNAPVADLAGNAGCRGKGALIHVSSLPIVQSGT